MDPRLIASASSAPRAPADALSSRYREISTRLFGEDPGPHGHPSNIEALKVKVHRARNVPYGLAEKRTPQVFITVGSATRSTPKGKAFGENPIFDWSTEFRHNGQETHVVFELCCGKRMVGQAYLPLTPVRQAGTLSRVLPLMSHGKVAGLDGEDGELSEIVVTVECIPAQAGTQALGAVETVRRNCKQLRVTVKSIDVKVKQYSDTDPAALNPCVHVDLGGPQTAETPVAFRTHASDAEEFVFMYPNRRFDCGGIMRGRNQFYEAAPVPPRPGSYALPGYRKQVGDNVKVTYRDVKHVFWYSEQEFLELRVVDDHVLLPDETLVISSTDIDELFALALQGCDNDVPAVLRTGPVRKPLNPLELQLRDFEQEVNEVGEIEFEVEFFQDPIACPSSLEPLYRRLGQLKRETQDAHYMAIKAVDEVTSANSTDGIMQRVPSVLRTALADVIMGALIASIREVVRHEEDGMFCQERVGKTCQEIGIVLQLPPRAIEEYDTLGRSALPVLPLARQAELYNEHCALNSMHRLLAPLATMAELLRQRGGYGATVRCALRDSFRAIAGEEYNGVHAFGLMERFLLDTLPGIVPSTFPRLYNKCLNSEEILQLATEPQEADINVTQLELQASIGEAKQEVGKFLPSIDPSRLISATKHPGEVLQISKDSKRTLLAGSAAVGFTAGLAGGLGVQQTAKLIHELDDKFFCNPYYHTGIGINKYICKFLKETPADEFIANQLATHKGFILFFWIYFILFTWGTYDRLSLRFARLHELTLERMYSAPSPHAMICVSGFLLSRSHVFTPWLLCEKYPWTDAQVYAVRYETEHLLALGEAFKAAMAKMAKQTVQAANMAMAFTNPVSLSQTIITTIGEEIADVFDLVSRRSWEAGKYLCHSLLSTALSEVDEDYDAEQSDEEATSEIIRPVRTVSFCAYSMGCIVVQACLKELQKIADSTDPRAPIAADLVCDVVLIGGPIVDTDEEYSALRRLVNGRFVNGYVSGDKALVGRQVRRGFRSFAGCTACSNVPGIENIPLDDFISTHAHYYLQMPSILMKIFHGS